MYTSRGNAQETNFTSLKIHLGFYQISKKFSYYGTARSSFILAKKTWLILAPTPN